MKRYLLALICLNCLVSLVYAQEETRIEEKDTLSSLESEVGLIPESLDANVVCSVLGMCNISQKERTFAMMTTRMSISRIRSISTACLGFPA